jgi:hypothetical protein
MFWDWLLKYSSFLITGLVSLGVGWLLNRLTSKWSDLVYYTGPMQAVQVPIPPQASASPADGPPPAAPPVQPVSILTVFLWNQGRAPARDVYVGHTYMPLHTVSPDLPRNVEALPGGGEALRFPVLPPKVVVTISYLVVGQVPPPSIVQYVGSEDGPAKHVPVMLQRVWPAWVNRVAMLLMLLGVWVAVNLAWSVIRLLWTAYYSR